MRTVLPTPVRYGGMPADRFWEIEDGTSASAASSTGRTDLARLLLAEFALTYGNDWFVIPVDLPVGSVRSVDAFEVTDTFGDRDHGRAVAPTPAARAWRHVRARRARRAARVSEPVLPRRRRWPRSPESAPVEEVAFFRDEMANVVWGVERAYQGGAGDRVDRYEEHQRRARRARSGSTTDFGDAQLLYRLQTDVPDHWHPFVPVRARRGRADARRRSSSSGARSSGCWPTARARRPAARPHPDRRGAAPARGGGGAARAAPRSTRTFQLARWTDGRYHLWSGGTQGTGRGEGSSGLRFDVVAPVAET